MRRFCVSIFLLYLIAMARATEDRTWEDLIGRVDQCIEGGRYDEAALLSAEALEVAATAGRSDARTATALNRVALVNTYLGRYSQAETAYRTGIQLLEGCGCQNLVHSQLLDGLATLYAERGVHNAEAERLRRRALDLGVAALGPENPEIGVLLVNLAATLRGRNRIPEMAALYERGLRLLEPAAATHPSSIGSALTNRAVLAHRLGHYGDAVTDLTRAIALYETALGSAHPELVRPLLNLGRVYLKLGRPWEAEAQLRRAAAIAGASFNVAHPLVGEVASTYALALRKCGRKEEARDMDARAKAVLAAHPEAAGNLIVDVSQLAK